VPVDQEYLLLGADAPHPTLDQAAVEHAFERSDVVQERPDERTFLPAVTLLFDVMFAHGNVVEASRPGRLRRH
jgi:hypothetical protein